MRQHQVFMETWMVPGLISRKHKVSELISMYHYNTSGENFWVSSGIGQNGNVLDASKIAYERSYIRK